MVCMTFHPKNSFSSLGISFTIELGTISIKSEWLLFPCTVFSEGLTVHGKCTLSGLILIVLSSIVTEFDITTDVGRLLIIYSVIREC